MRPSELLTLTAPDSYTAAATISNTPIRRIVLDVLNQAIYWQLQIGVGASGVWETIEHFNPPGSRVLARAGTTGIRVRAATPAASLPAGATQAFVNIEAVK